MFKQRYLFVLLLSAAMLTACVKTSEAPKENGAAVLPDVIKLGTVNPLTGNAASYGQDVRAGIDFYFQEHPTISGKKVELIHEDGKCNGQDAANAAQKLINMDKVAVIFGGSCSGETLAMAPIAEQAKVVTIGSLCSSPKITTAGDYIFRDYPSDAQVAGTMIEDLARRGFRKIAMLSEQTEFDQGYRIAIKEHLKNYPDIALVVDEAYAVDNTDFRTLLTKVKDGGADVLISLAQTPVTHGFTVRQARELGIDIQVYGPDSMDGPDFFNTAKDAAEGALQAVVVEDPTRENYKAFTARAPKPQSSYLFMALGYDAAGIIAQAIEKAGYDGTKIKDYLYAMPTYVGVVANHKFDQNGDDQLKAGIKIVKDGKLVLLEE